MIASRGSQHLLSLFLLLAVAGTGWAISVLHAADEPVAGAAARAVEPAGQTETSQGGGQANPFSPIATPTPPPPDPPKPPLQPNNLDRALRNWVLEYPKKDKQEWVFSDRTNREQTYTVEIGKPCRLRDLREFEAQVAPNGKYGVQFEYEGQVRKFSLVE